MSTRTQLAGELQTRLGSKFSVVPFDRDLGPIDASLSAVVVVDAPTYAPAGPAGRLALTYKLHVVTPYTDPGLVADAFDNVLPAVFDVLDTIPNAVWSDASPSNYDEQKPSYVIQLTLQANRSNTNV